jgi:hypothetical protein
MQQFDPTPEKPGADRLPSAALEVGWSQLALGNQQTTMNAAYCRSIPRELETSPVRTPAHARARRTPRKSLTIAALKTVSPGLYTINVRLALVSRKKPQESQRNPKIARHRHCCLRAETSLMENLFIENKGFVYYDFK